MPFYNDVIIALAISLFVWNLVVDDLIIRICNNLSKATNVQSRSPPISGNNLYSIADIIIPMRYSTSSTSSGVRISQDKVLIMDSFLCKSRSFESIIVA